MNKNYYSLGLMSGTSMDGVDASIIRSDGKAKYTAILDKYFQYPKGIYKNLTTLRDKIKNSKDIKKYRKQLKSIEKKITIFHAESVIKILKKKKINIEFIGFHGQTIFHNPEEKISVQLGDGKLLSQLTKKKVVYDFRKNDLKKGGQGAPLTPIFHALIAHKFKFRLPVIFVNIGGITNATYLLSSFNINKINQKEYKNWYAKDLCPGNCLIDQWIRKHSKKNFDIDGNIAKSGKINQIKLLNGLNDYPDIPKRSLDIKDFNLSFANDLSLKDGAATLTEYTAEVFSNSLGYLLQKPIVILTGGGRKNKFLIKRIKEKTFYPIKLIDDYGINGDFIESQAFAYLAIRSYLGLPISYPKTTGCKKSCTGGILVKKF